MSKLIFASLISLTSLATLPATAQTAPQPPTPPGPPTTLPHVCSKTSPEFAGVSVRHHRIATDRGATPVMIDTDASFTVLDSGAWSFTKFDAAGKATRKAEGCLDDARVDALRALYTKATWQTTSVIHCMMATNSFTEYTFHGRMVWNARVCGSTKLDDDSQKAITAITVLMDDVTKPSPIETSRGKPTK